MFSTVVSRSLFVVFVVVALGVFATPVAAQSLTGDVPACTEEHTWWDRMIGNCLEVDPADAGVLDLTAAQKAVEDANVAINDAAEKANVAVKEAAGTSNGNADIMVENNPVSKGAWSIWDLFSK